MYDSTNAPPEVAAVKVMLEASTTWIAMSGTIHYPSTSNGDSASADSPPYCLIEPSKSSPRVLAPGVVVPGGSIQVLLTMVDSAGASIEKKARAILDDMATMSTGLPITAVDVGMCSEPNAGARAAQEFSDQNTLGDFNALRTIPMIITYGLS